MLTPTQRPILNGKLKIISVVNKFWFAFFRKNIHNEKIEEGNSKYNFTNSLTDAFLKINNITIYDRGNYTLIASNNYETKTLNLFLNVTGEKSAG